FQLDVTFDKRLAQNSCSRHQCCSKVVEIYSEVEARIQSALETLERAEKPNIAGTAHEFDVPVSRLRGRWKGRQSRDRRPPPNRRLSEPEELAVCQYLERLDRIGTSARVSMVTGCTNAIL